MKPLTLLQIIETGCNVQVVTVIFISIDFGYTRSLTTRTVSIYEYLIRAADQPPSSQWQRLQLQCRRPNVRPECHDPNYYTYHIGDVVPVPLDHTRSATVNASMLFRFRDTRE